LCLFYNFYQFNFHSLHNIHLTIGLTPLHFKMRSTLSLLPAVLFATAAFGHGTIVNPPARAAGDAMKAACGEQVFNNQKSDNQGNVQGEIQIASSQKDYDPTKCNLFLCKGYQFPDNSANIQAFTPGQVVPMTIKIGAPHTGTANVSIVDTKANAVIGDQLIYFADYASNSHTIPANNTQFDITMPTDLGGKCAQAGDCVIQWFWDAPEAKQTYESCVDFTMSGGGAAPASTSTPAATTVPSSSASPVAAPSASAAAGPDDDCPPVPVGILFLFLTV
jgi:hypothetical protein